MFILFYILCTCIAGIFVFRDIMKEPFQQGEEVSASVVAFLVSLFWPLLLFGLIVYLIFTQSNKGIDYLIAEYNKKEGK